MQTRLVLMICTMMVATTISTEAWSQGGTYGGGIIAPGSPPLTLAGTSGGPRQARSMGSSCRGTIAVRPDHVFTVTTPMTVRFEVVNAGGDTTMVVVGPSGIICDDDSGSGVNPRVMQHLMPGQYQVYVGTYSGRNMYPYTLQVQGQGGHQPMPTPHVPSGARFGAAVLGPGSMNATLNGTSGGPVSARSRGSRCRGHINPMPSHIVRVLSPMVATFDVNGPGDTTLVVVGRTGTHCNDDGGNGFNPRLTIPLQPGVYQVFVGSYSRGQSYPYTLRLHP